jgi:hypothetical protein
MIYILWPKENRAIFLPARSNKIRFVLVEADISDGNLTELTSAITNALKPTYPVPRPALPRPASPITLPAAPNGDEPEVLEPEEVETPEGGTAEAEPTAAPKPARKKTYKTPEYSPNLFADKGAAFKEFAKQKAPPNKQQKYLVAAYWLKEHGNNPTVNADKIFTCFKTAGWSVGFLDWNQPFHNLVHSKEMRKEGNEWAINPLGEDAVVKGTE